MIPKNKKINHKDFIKHETKRHLLLKFILVTLVFVIYFIFITLKYGVKDGFYVTSLTWSFFVLCTPIADAGFLLDFPFRLITKIRMLFSEIIVWIIAILLNTYTYFARPEIYEKTQILSLLKHILSKPFPFWSIILISATGTFISIQFGDELIDKAKHKDRNFYNRHKKKHKIWISIFIIVLAIITYDFLLKQLGVKLPI